YFFFFQAEDGIRDFHVTGVQTCALPIFTELNTEDLGIRVPEHFTIGEGPEEIDVWVILPDGVEKVPLLLNIHGGPASQYSHAFRSEERRVGKECRCRRSEGHVEAE